MLLLKKHLSDLAKIFRKCCTDANNKLMEHFLKILFFSDFIWKRIVKILNFESCIPKLFNNFLIKNYEKKRLHYLAYIGCVLIHINFEQFIICGFVLLRFSVKRLNNFLV